MEGSYKSTASQSLALIIFQQLDFSRWLLVGLPCFRSPMLKSSASTEKTVVFNCPQMGKIHHHNLVFPFLLLFLLIQFSSHLLLSTAYNLPDKYFINCGSSSTVTVNGRNFVGDVNPSSSSSFSVGLSSAVKDDTPSASSSSYSLHGTARIFEQQTSYEFQTTANGTYLVRFHFYPFSNLANALFSVSASAFSLLSNFTVGNSSNAIKEFAVPVEAGKFTIDFTPQRSSIGFVNAIEAFPAPENFISDEIPHVTPVGIRGSYKGLLSHALHTIHRINVGGETITPENDTLGRNWIPDDNYLYFRDAAKKCQPLGGRPNYLDGGASEYSAPDHVYKTANEMNITNTREPNLFNVTWIFDVNKNSIYFVRAHFCDIISPSLGLLTFNFHVYSRFRDEINPSETMQELAAPFYRDYVVDSDDSGHMNISIGPRRDSSIQNAFLNGLEIMELTKGSGLVHVANKPKKRSVKFALIGSVVGGVALVLVLLAVIFWVRKCRKAKNVEAADWVVPYYGRGSFSTDKTVDISSVSSLNLGLKIPFSEILHATNNFNPRLMIGEGGFGKVYQGTLRNGRKVAVKRSQPGSRQGFSEFQTEIRVLSRIRHRHLVSLIGYCDERSEMILVYEFMEKGTLRDHLYPSNGSNTQKLSWNQRLEICIGSARGLHYLHTGSEGGIIHRDVKSTNILLDEYYVAKVADFGLSKSGPPDQSHCSTDVKGSFGYLDPEYFRCLQLTEKSDVYSFGVVLLEVLCARPAIDNSLPREEMNLAEWGMSWQKKGQLEKIVDPFLAGKINQSSLRKFSEIIEKCLRESGADRPPMRDVLWDLEYTLQLQQVIMNREKHDDSVTDTSMELPLPMAVVQRLPSNSLQFGEDDESEPNASDVFSQLRMGGGGR